jgi:hypothetical protein
MALKITSSATNAALGANASIRDLRVTIDVEHIEASGIYTDPLSGNRFFTHPVSISDLSILVVQKEFSDSLGTFSDYTMSVVDKGIEDSVGTPDALTYQLTTRYADSAVLVELISNNPAKNVADSLGTFSDYAVPVVDKGVEDSVGTPDIFTRTVEYSRTFTDAFALDDATTVNKNYSGTKGNVFAFSDSNSWGVEKSVTDSLGAFSDYAVSVVGKGVEDSVGVPDTLAYQLNTQQEDAVAITDLITIEHRASNILNNSGLNVAILNS